MGLGSDTESYIAKRLNQIAKARNIPQDVLSSVYIQYIPNEEDLETFLRNLREKSFRKGEDIRLIVLDSIATLFRIPETTSNKKQFYIQRSNLLFRIASYLKLISDLYHIPIIIINQATTSSSSSVIPSLGLSWSNCINTRFFVTRKEEEKFSHDVNICSTTKFNRFIQVTLSSSLPSEIVRFSIRDSG